MTQVHTAALECVVEIVTVADLGSGLEKSLMGSLERKLQEAQTLEKNAAAKSLILQGLKLLSSTPFPMQE